jgi:hypothetical protein
MTYTLKPEDFADYLRQHATSQRPNVRAELEHIANEVQAMRQDADDEDALRARMAQLLTDTTNALKGAPAELHRHSWHDLPEIAARMHEALMAVMNGKPPPGFKLLPREPTPEMLNAGAKFSLTLADAYREMWDRHE